MLSVALSLALALLLLVSAGMKLASGPAGRAALATYGIRGEPLASVAWAALGAIEAGLAVGLAAGAEGAAWATAALFTAFTAAQAAALMRGRAGAPCGCFGARGRIGRASIGRAALLATAAAVLPLLERRAADHRGVAGDRPRRGAGRRRGARGRRCSRWRARSGSCGWRSRRRARWRSPARAPRSAGAPRWRSTSPGSASRTSGSRSSPRRAATSAGRSRRRSRPSTATRASTVRRFDEVEDAGAWALADVPGQPVRGRRRRRRHGAGQGHVQLRRSAGERAGRGRAAPRGDQCLSPASATAWRAPRSRRGSSRAWAAA